MTIKGGVKRHNNCKEITKNVTKFNMKYNFLSILLFFTTALHCQDGDFNKLLELYDGQQNRIDSISAKIFFDFTPNEDEFGILTDQILIQKPNFVGLSCYLPCGAGGICESIYSRYSGNIRYFDYVSGVNSQANDCFSAYDPDGSPNYVPLTTVLTKGPNNTIIWHSWEGVVEEPILMGWVDDAINYHSEY